MAIGNTQFRFRDEIALRVFFKECFIGNNGVFIVSLIEVGTSDGGLNFRLKGAVCGVLECQLVVHARVVIVLLPSVNRTLIEVCRRDILAFRELRDEVRISTDRFIISAELVQAISRFIHRFGLQIRIVLEFLCSDFIELLIRLLVVGFVEKRLRDQVLCVIFKIGIWETIKNRFKCLSGVLVVLQFIVQLPDSVPSVFDEKAVREVLNELCELRFRQFKLLCPIEDVSPEIG